VYNEASYNGSALPYICQSVNNGGSDFYGSGCIPNVTWWGNGFAGEIGHAEAGWCCDVGTNHTIYGYAHN